MEYNFNVDDIIRFKINDKQNIFKSYFKNGLIKEYENYKVNNVVNPDFVINIQNFQPNVAFILDSKYYLNNGYLSTNDEYKLAKWSIEIKKTDQEFVININPNLFGRFFISGFFVDPILHYVLTMRGYSVIHSAGVSNNGEAFLFSGRGGSGKTTLSINLMNYNTNYNYLGDDFSIIKEGFAYPFITPLNLFTYNIDKKTYKRLSYKNKLNLLFSQLIYFGTLKYAKFFIKMNLKDYFNKRITQKSKIKKLFLLYQTNKEYIDVVEESKKNAIKILTYNQMLDSEFIPKYLLQYGFFDPNSDLNNFWSNYKNNLRLNLTSNIKFYKISVPRYHDKNTLLKIIGSMIYE